MKKIFFSFFYFICFFQVLAQKQQFSKLEPITHFIPQSKSTHLSFKVNDYDQVFILSNGGIYMAKDSFWFIPPVNKMSFTGFAANEKDTSLLVVSNKKDSSEIYFLKNKNKEIIKLKLFAIEKGQYELLYQNKSYFIWGISQLNISKIGMITGKNVNWIYQSKKKITQVKFNSKAEILFSQDSSILNFNQKIEVYKMNNPIIGFTLDAYENILVSTKEGVGYLRNNVFELFTEKIHGLIECSKKSIYVLPLHGGVLAEFRQMLPNKSTLKK